MNVYMYIYIYMCMYMESEYHSVKIFQIEVHGNL